VFNRYCFVITYLLLVVAVSACNGGSSNSNPSNVSPRTPVTLGNFVGSVISDDSLAEVWQPAVYNNNGSAMVLWYENNGTTTNNFFKYWDANKAVWSEPASLPFSSSNTIVTTRGSDFLAVIYSYNSLQYSLFDGAAWSTPTTIATNINGSPVSISSIYNVMAFSTSTGNLILFNGQDTTQNIPTIYALHFNGTQWSDLEIYATDNGSNLKSADSNGDSTVFYWTGYVSGDALPYKYYLSLKTPSGVITQAISESASNITPQYFSIQHSNTEFAASWVLNDGSFDRIYATQIDASLVTPAWSAVAPMDQGTENSLMPALASNGSGFALVWATQTTHEVTARIYSATWSTEQPLNDSANSSGIRDIRLTSNGTGYAAVWYNRPVFAPDNRYRYYGAIHNGTSWLTTAVLGVGGQNDNLQYKPLRIISDGTDYAVAWIDSVIENNVQDPFLSVFGTVSSGDLWSASPQKIYPTLIRYNNFVLGGLFLALNRYSDGFGVIWPQMDKDHGEYYGSTFNTVNGWSAAAAVLSPQSNGSSLIPAVARNNNGDLAAVWAQYDLGYWKYYINTKNANGWSRVKQIVECSDSTFETKIDIVSNGDDFMIACFGYDYSGFSGQSRIFLVPFDGKNFGAREAIANYSNETGLASNGNGYAFATGVDTGSGTFSISALIYDGQNWSTATVADQLTGFSHLKLSGNGNTYSMSWYADAAISQSIYNTTNQNWDTVPVTNGASAQFDMQVTGPNNIVYAWADGSIHSMHFSNGNFTGPLDVEAITTASFNTTPSLSQSTNKLGVVWLGNGNIYANYFDMAWGAIPDTVATLGGGAMINKYPNLVSTNGDFAVSWSEQSASTEDFYVSTLRKSDTNWEAKLTTHQDGVIFADQTLFTDGATFRIIGTLAQDGQDFTNNYARVWVSDNF